MHGELSSCCSQPLPRDTQRCRAGALLAPKTSPDPLPSTAPGKIDQCAFIDHLYTPKKMGGEGKKKKNVAIETLIELPPSWSSSPPPAGGPEEPRRARKFWGWGPGRAQHPPVPNTSTEPRCPPRPRKPGVLCSPQGSLSCCLSFHPSVHPSVHPSSSTCLTHGQPPPAAGSSCWPRGVVLSAVCLLDITMRLSETDFFYFFSHFFFFPSSNQALTPSLIF